MERTALTLEQAQAISKDLQCLLGYYLDPYANSYKYIRYVVPAPYDENSRHIFMYDWNQLRDPQEALQQYKGDTYDIILVAGDPAVEDYPAVMDVRTFLEEQGRSSDLPLIQGTIPHLFAA